MKLLLENHSGDVNIQSGPDRILHPFPAGILIHIAPESLFTSLRNVYSHTPEYADILFGVSVDTAGAPGRIPFAITGSRRFKSRGFEIVGISEGALSEETLAELVRDTVSNIMDPAA